MHASPAFGGTDGHMAAHPTPISVTNHAPPEHVAEAPPQCSAYEHARPSAPHAPPFSGFATGQPFGGQAPLSAHTPPEHTNVGVHAKPS